MKLFYVQCNLVHCHKGCNRAIAIAIHKKKYQE